MYNNTNYTTRYKIQGDENNNTQLDYIEIYNTTHKFLGQ